MTNWQGQGNQLDHRLSKRHIPLDPLGYFIIFVDPAQGQIGARHFTVTVNARGLAIDPITGKPLNAKSILPDPPTQEFRARTAKEMCIQIFEGKTALVSYLDHAAYLGREFQKAEYALFTGSPYIQD
ncbi:DUF4346 domain-containing protein [Candidatus Cyanaurora vandensis]|uniref:DUF4346 domain-containing protein n=1 Tax=Candidatus Cyanaurora vandensis TaxID=2714958 RepID=UPI00257A535D|nr:DUF4346 domain-containing protein [Candidatus Cyanaurora vandensis]